MYEYSKIGWKNNQPPALNQNNLNHMDDGIALAHERLNNNETANNKKFEALEKNKQDKLIGEGEGQNIKTVGGISIMGKGDIPVGESGLGIEVAGNTGLPTDMPLEDIKIMNKVYDIKNTYATKDKLKDKVDKIDGKSLINIKRYIDNDDFDNYFGYGFYQFGTGNKHTPIPNSNYWRLIVNSTNDDKGEAVQIATEVIGGRTFIRVYANGAWSSWKRFIYQTEANENLGLVPDYNNVIKNIYENDSASVSTYTALDNGFISVSCSSTSGIAYILLQVNKNNIGIIRSKNDIYTSVIMPVSKGDTIKMFKYGNYPYDSFDNLFIYAKKVGA